MKVPTAKVILSNYRKKDHIYIKKSDKTVPREVEVEETPQIKLEEPVSEQVDEYQEAACAEVPQPVYPLFYWLPATHYGAMIIF